MTIRSFVIREGRMTDAQKRAINEQWPHFGLDYQDSVVDMAAAFEREAPMVMEIGFGNGEALRHMATADPERNYIGVEVHRPGVGHLLKRIAQDELANIRVFQHDAVAVVRDCLAPESLSRVNIYFPDPWPKKRHHKRRLLQPPFLKLLASRMNEGALLHVATDWQNYAEHMLEVLNLDPFFDNTVNGSELDQACVPRPDERPLTKFEQRGQRKGHGVWDLLFKRNSVTN